MAVVSKAVLKAYFQTGDFPTQSQFEDLIDTLFNDSTSIYKRYVALLTQTGTDAPVATVLENTTGGTIAWTYDGVGTYFADATGFTFTANKTTVAAGSTGSNNDVFIVADGSNLTTTRITLMTSKEPGTSVALSDDVLINSLIEIRIYP